MADNVLDEQLMDRPECWRTTSHTVLARGRVSNFVEDEIVPPEGPSFTRQYVTHPGAVAVIALDDQDRVAVIDQYRHPVAHRLVEPPAGLLDLEGEDFVVAAQRELAEEAKLAARRWEVLVDLFSTPGGCAESIRVYLARELSVVDRPEGFDVTDEEAHMELHWVPLGELVEAIHQGHVQSPSLVAGVLALHSARLDGRIKRLRPADSAWPAREAWRRAMTERSGTADGR